MLDYSSPARPIQSLTIFLLILSCRPALGTSRCEDACYILSHSGIPTLEGSDAVLSLWSEFQSKAVPTCRVQPRNAVDISEVVQIVRDRQCHFTVLGGGTSPFRGASNAVDGLTIDLRRLRTLRVHYDDSQVLVEVGAGNRWADVYGQLDKLSMSATGTRNSLTGVVGSILGGGISFFSEQHGWACDTVVEFEVVLANGSIVIANYGEGMNSDLFFALKGGGTNFGIVSRVTIEAFRDPPSWYTFQRFGFTDRRMVFERLEAHALQIPDLVHQVAVTLQWHVPSQEFVLSERMVASELPTLLEGPAVLQTVAYERSILDMAEKMDVMNPYGYFNFFGSITLLNNAETFAKVAEVFATVVEDILDSQGLQVYIVFNPLTKNALTQMQKHGGNSLGLSRHDGPLIILNLNLRWSQAEDETKMRHFMRRLIEGVELAAQESGALHPYVFLNHAFDEQDVFDGYGEGSLARLRATRQMVDPDGLFQVLKQGPFKLGVQGSENQRWVKDEL